MLESILFPKLNCLSLSKWGKDPVKLGFYMIHIWPSASRECVGNDLAAIRRWLVNHWVWHFLLIFGGKSHDISHDRAHWYLTSLSEKAWIIMTISFPPGNRWPSWTQWPPSIPACRHLESSYFYVWLFSSPALLVSTLIIANKHIFGTYSAFSIFTVSEYLVMHMNLFSVFFWLRARWPTSSWLDFRMEFLFYSCIECLPWGGHQSQNHLHHRRLPRI